MAYKTFARSAMATRFCAVSLLLAVALPTSVEAASQDAKHGRAISIRYEPGAPFAAPISRAATEAEADPMPAADDQVRERRLVQDFEGNVQLNPWPETGRLEFSTEWKAAGARSVKIHGGTKFAFSELAVRNWAPYQMLRIHTFVPGNTGVAVGIEIADAGPGHLNRHQNTGSAPSGEGTIDLDISGNLWRGEVNRPNRLLKTPIDKRDIRRLAVSTTGDGSTLLIDRIELLQVDKPAVAGG